MGDRVRRGAKELQGASELPRALRRTGERGRGRASLTELPYEEVDGHDKVDVLGNLLILKIVLQIEVLTDEVYDREKTVVGSHVFRSGRQMPKGYDINLEGAQAVQMSVLVRIKTAYRSLNISCTFAAIASARAACPSGVR
jgi:hypothetical protein